MAVLMQNKIANTIIVVDDDEDLNEILKYSLQSKGYQVLTFINGKDTYEFLADENNLDQIALIILDRLLPDCDGIEILKHIIAKYPTRFPVMILSRLTAESEQLLGFKHGTFDYVPKPFNLTILVQKADSLITYFRKKSSSEQK